MESEEGERVLAGTLSRQTRELRRRREYRRTRGILDNLSICKLVIVELTSHEAASWD